MLRVVICAINLGMVALLFTSFRQPQGKPYIFPELNFFPAMPRDSTNPVTVGGVALGRMLFYDPILSEDSTMSCANCHKQAHAFSDAPNAFSMGRGGAVMQRNTLPLFNLAWYPTLFWDGRAENIEAQVFHPVRTYEEMNLQWSVAAERIARNKVYRQKFREVFGAVEIDSILIGKAIAQFERTLISYRSKYDSVLAGKAYFTEEEFAGFELVNDMTKGDCLHCHSTDGDALGTIPGFSNNGLDAAQNPSDYRDKGRGVITGKTWDYGKFKIPTLRNLAFTAPYMHDGRFKTLEEVIDFYSEGVKPGANIDSKMEFVHAGGARLSTSDKRKIIAFLNTMNDYEFVSDPAFANPLTKH